MNEILISVGVGVFIIYAAFNIASMIEMRRTSIALRRLVSRTEVNLHPALAALRGILEDIGKATANIEELSEHLREVSETAARVEKSISGMYDYYKNNFDETARANFAGLKAGVKAGVVTLLKDLNDRKEGSS